MSTSYCCRQCMEKIISRNMHISWFDFCLCDLSLTDLFLSTSLQQTLAKLHDTSYFLTVTQSTTKNHHKFDTGYSTKTRYKRKLVTTGLYARYFTTTKRSDLRHRNCNYLHHLWHNSKRREDGEIGNQWNPTCLQNTNVAKNKSGAHLQGSRTQNSLKRTLQQ